MIWQDEVQESKTDVAKVCDLSFAISARTLPLDHAWSLSREILQHLPWLESEHRAAIHLINYPGEVSTDGNEAFAHQRVFHVSRRARLTLRLPLERISDAACLCNTTIGLDGHELSIGASKERTLVPSDTLIARHVIHDQSLSEPVFVERIAAQIEETGVRVRKIVCGKSSRFRLPDETLSVRSVMVTDLRPEQSITLQCNSLGTGRLMGCGIFLPHKGIGQLKRQD